MCYVHGNAFILLFNSLIWFLSSKSIPVLVSAFNKVSYMSILPKVESGASKRDQGQSYIANMKLAWATCDSVSKINKEINKTSWAWEMVHLIGKVLGLKT